jgi:hypothetical protein
MLLDITRQTPLLPQTSSEIKRNYLVDASDIASTLMHRMSNTTCNDGTVCAVKGAALESRVNNPQPLLNTYCDMMLAAALLQAVHNTSQLAC